MKIPLLFSLLFFAGASFSPGQEADADFKVAGVNVQRVFQEFYKTRITEADINEERIRIQKEDRKMRSQLKVIDADLHQKGTEGRFDDEGNEIELSEEELESRNLLLKRLVADRNKLNQDRQNRYRQSNDRLNGDMLKTMHGIIGEIQRFIEAHAEKTGLDVVFDTSGTTTNQTSPVLGGKGLLDVTATVIAELNKDDPALTQSE